jgi:regulator of replication initiation timing
MNSIRKLKDKIRELQNYVDENTRLALAIQSSKYPLSIEFCENQIDMFSEENSSASPSLCFVFDDEMRIITTENFKINEAVFNKLKNLSKEINRLYLHAFREEIDKVIEPMWNVADDVSQVAIYRKKYFDRVMNHSEE